MESALLIYSLTPNPSPKERGIRMLCGYWISAHYQKFFPALFLLYPLSWRLFSFFVLADVFIRQFPSIRIFKSVFTLTQLLAMLML